MEPDAKELLARFGQKHLIEDLKQFSQEERDECLVQLKRWQLEGMKTSWELREQQRAFEPFTEVYAPVTGVGTKKGAALFLAGGQGSRLGFEGPKGCYPLLGKTLFQRHCEKIHLDALVAILTSRLNHRETSLYFDRQERFGLKKLSFCCQDTLPLLDEEGKWFWAAPGQIAEGPDGNGSVFAAMERSGVLQRFKEEGIELLHIIPVDNPLADPFDSELAAFHEANKADLSFRCIRLEESEEPMGRLVRAEGLLAIAEFAELTAEQRVENRFANTGLWTIDLGLAQALAKENFPLHWAWKSASAWEGGRRRKCQAWKAERFIVDALAFAKRPCALLSERDSCYAPLKEKKSIGEIERRLMV